MLTSQTSKIFWVLQQQCKFLYFLFLRLEWVHHVAAVFLLVCFCSHGRSPFVLFFTDFAVSASKIYVCLSPCFLMRILYLCLSTLLLSSMEGVFYSFSSFCPCDGLLSITYPILTDKLQPLQRSDLGVRFVSICVFR